MMRQRRSFIRLLRRPSRGFTLIEMLIVVSLLAVVTLAAYHALVDGYGIWERSRQFVGEEDVSIFLDKITLDLQNAMDYSLLPPKGDAQKVSFCTMVHVLEDSKVSGGQKVYTDQIGRVEYYFDADRQGIYVREANYGQATDKKYGRARLLASPVQSLTFSYYYGRGKDEKEEPKIKDKGGLPSAVEVTVTLADTNGVRRLSRLINVPMGNPDL